LVSWVDQVEDQLSPPLPWVGRARCPIHACLYCPLEWRRMWGDWRRVLRRASILSFSGGVWLGTAHRQAFGWLWKPISKVFSDLAIKIWYPPPKTKKQSTSKVFSEHESPLKHIEFYEISVTPVRECLLKNPPNLLWMQPGQMLRIKTYRNNMNGCHPKSCYHHMEDKNSYAKDSKS
jgi:hypothetical protein